MKYTFTFPYTEERVFKEVVSRLDPDEFVVIEDIKALEPIREEDPRYTDRQTIIEMEPEAASTFRFRMGDRIKIRRERTEEELAEEKEINDRNTIKVTVHVPMGDPPAAT
jgi:formylmethanofuran dehydrogenase subunit D